MCVQLIFFVILVICICFNPSRSILTCADSFMLLQPRHHSKHVYEQSYTRFSVWLRFPLPMLKPEHMYKYLYVCLTNFFIYLVINIHFNHHFQTTHPITLFQSTSTHPRLPTLFWTTTDRYPFLTQPISCCQGYPFHSLETHVQLIVMCVSQVFFVV